MQIGNDSCQAAIDLFREGMPFVVSAQARFHVTELDSAVEGKQGSSDNCSCIANCQHPVWFEIRQNRIQDE